MSSLKDLASLIMIPSLYKDGELHTVKPLADENVIIHPDATDNNDGVDGSTPTTSSNFTFSRGSNLAPTRVASSSYIEKGRENLLLQSNQFDTTWSIGVGITRTSGQSGYDGSSDAWLISKTGGFAYLYQSVSQSGVFTFSAYMKAGSLNWGRLQVIDGGNNPRAFFDLQNGVLGTRLSDINSSIEAVGNGWYRCSIVVNSSATQVRIYPADADADVSGTSGSIYIQDAQLEQGLVATDYIETGTSAAQSGILEDMPRLDYSGGASCPALLLEPQRTNVLTHSEYFGGWGQINTLNTANALISPEGVQNANKLIAASGVNNNVINQQISAGTYTASVFAKKGEFEGLFIGSGPTGAFFNLNTYAYRTHYQSAPTSYKIEDYGNGWHRYSITFTISGNDSLYIGPNDNVSNTLGVTGNNSNGIYIFGATLEQGSYPTSYIPTYGTSQTRSNESASVLNLDTNNIVGDTQWSFLAEFDVDGNAPSTDKIRLTNATNMPRVYLYNDAAGFAGGWGGAMTAGQNRVKVLWRLNTLRSADIFAVGAKQVSVTAQPSDLIVDRLLLNGNQGTFKLYNITIFPTALTDSECIALTTL